jgi:hypothetical protein
MNSAEQPVGAEFAPDVLTWYYGILFRPKETLATYRLDKALGAAGLAVALVAVIGGYVSAGGGASTVMLGFFTWLGWLLVSWLVLTSLVFVIGHVMKRKGEFGALLASTGLAYLPLLLLGPLNAVASWGVFGTAVAALGMIAVFLWWVRLLVAAVRQVMQLSTAQAVMAIVAAEVVLVGLPWLLFTLGVMSLALAVA